MAISWGETEPMQPSCVDMFYNKGGSFQPFNEIHWGNVISLQKCAKTFFHKTIIMKHETFSYSPKERNHSNVTYVTYYLYIILSVLYNIQLIWLWTIIIIIKWFNLILLCIYPSYFFLPIQLFIFKKKYHDNFSTSNSFLYLHN